MRNKNLVISTVRGLAIILVVYGHVIQRSMMPVGQDFFLNPAFKLIYTFHMPLFIFISGYVMAYSLDRRSLLDVLKVRRDSLLIPFIVWGILGVISIYLVNIFDGKNIGVIDFSGDLFDDLVLRPSIWFLFVLFVSSCMLLCSVRLEKKLGLAAFGLVYSLVLLIPFNGYCSLFFIKWFYLFYAAGYFVNRYDLKITDRYLKAGVLFSLLIVFLFLVSFWAKSDYIYVNKTGFVSDNYFYGLLKLTYRYAVAFAGIGVVFLIGSYLSATRFQLLLDKIGVYALDIYLIQRYAVEGIYPRLVSALKVTFEFDSFFFLGIVVPLVTAVATGLCVLVSKFLIRKNPLFNKLLLGGRA